VLLTTINHNPFELSKYIQYYINVYVPDCQCMYDVTDLQTKLDYSPNLMGEYLQHYLYGDDDENNEDEELRMPSLSNESERFTEQWRFGCSSKFYGRCLSIPNSTVIY